MTQPRSPSLLQQPAPKVPVVCLPLATEVDTQDHASPLRDTTQGGAVVAEEQATALSSVTACPGSGQRSPPPPSTGTTTDVASDQAGQPSLFNATLVNVPRVCKLCEYLNNKDSGVSGTALAAIGLDPVNRTTERYSRDKGGDSQSRPATTNGQSHNDFAISGYSASNQASDDRSTAAKDECRCRCRTSDTPSGRPDTSGNVSQGSFV